VRWALVGQLPKVEQSKLPSPLIHTAFHTEAEFVLWCFNNNRPMILAYMLLPFFIRNWAEGEGIGVEFVDRQL
jgi:hypothetical protein